MRGSAADARGCRHAFDGMCWRPAGVGPCGACCCCESATDERAYRLMHRIRVGGVGSRSGVDGPAPGRGRVAALTRVQRLEIGMDRNARCTERRRPISRLTWLQREQ